MLIPDSSNIVFQLAASFVNDTSRHLFLTGKAGTGKTTFLKFIQENTQKRTVVVAPTGVAAINAGGVTIHSFFQLPFGPFIPDDEERFSLMHENEETNNAFNLVKKIRLNGEKKELMRKMELLIIDEISMVRADMLDAMDVILRFVRRNSFQPFGGVQVLYIGDLFQLPPVVPDDQWEILRPHYASPFFFNAKVIKQAAPLYVELKKIYRQKDQEFIDVLNRVRNNTVTATDLQLLNDRYDPTFKSKPEDPYIVLSTHNRKTEIINASELERLSGPVYKFESKTTGEFSEKSMPTDIVLYLKEGAQILFIKNDPEKRFYNGKIGRISRIVDKVIYIGFENASEDFALTQEKWKNIRYTFDAEKNRIKEEEIGTFTQYPIRLAWAITIHKSQGLTFTKAIVDAGASFAAGQVYVALSRCTSLAGMVLRSKIERHCIKTDEKVIAFATKEAALNELQEQFEEEQFVFEKSSLVEKYDFSKVLEKLEALNLTAATAKTKKDQLVDPTLCKDLLAAAIDLQDVCAKFRIQLTQLLKSSKRSDNESLLQERLAKANTYFITNIDESLSGPLRKQIGLLKAKPNMRKQIKSLEDLLNLIIAESVRFSPQTVRVV